MAALLPRESLIILAYVIAAMWAVTLLADIALDAYEAPALVHTIMLTLTGAAFVAGTGGKNGNRTA